MVETLQPSFGSVRPMAGVVDRAGTEKQQGADHENRDPGANLEVVGDDQHDKETKKSERPGGRMEPSAQFGLDLVDCVTDAFADVLGDALHALILHAFRLAVWQ